MTTPADVTAALDGAGAASSWADLAAALDEGQPAGPQIAFAAAAAGLDSLGMIADPFDAVATAGLGWLVEHVAVLREPLDALAGDPGQILAQATRWHDVSRTLRRAAEDYEVALSSSTAGWHGAVADGYRAAAADLTRALDDVAGRAEQLSRLVLGTGAAVGSVRALIRDLIAEFLGELVAKVLVALASAPASMGGSTAAAVGAVAWEVHALARDIAARLSRLLDDLAAASHTAAELVAGMRVAMAQISAAARSARAAATPWAAAFDGLPAREVAEAGKQFSSAEATGDRQTGTHNRT